MTKFYLMILMSAGFVTTGVGQQTKADYQWAGLSNLTKGSEIRIVLNDGGIVRGFLQSASSATLAVNATTSVDTVARSNIKRIDRKSPGHRGRNTLIGFAIGAGTGLGVGAGVDHRSDGWFRNIGKEFFTPVGALVGAVIGVALPTGGWHTIYRSA